MISPADRDLLVAAADRYAGRLPLAELTVKSLTAVTAADGIDLATALLYDRLAAVVPPVSPSRLDRDVLVGIVPAAFWQQYPHTGGDGGRFLRLAADLGVAAERVPLPGFGRLAENAAILLDWLAGRRGRRLVLVTLSKGGPDLKTAIRLAGDRGTLDRHFGHVAAWLNVSGGLRGTPLVDWLDTRPLRRAGLRLILGVRGLSLAATADLRRGPGSPLWDWPPLPPHLRVTHVVGVPLRRHLAHRWAARGYDRLAPLGPNDGGGLLLGDAPAWPGVVRPVWGADHYLQPAWDVEPTLRDVLRDAIAGDQNAAASAV